MNHKVTFDNNRSVEVATGTLLTDAATKAGVFVAEPCGGQGRCGRCAVKVVSGAVRRRSTLRLSDEDVADGYALACQAVVEGDANILVPEQETLERRLTSDRLVADVQVPPGYDAQRDQSLQRVAIKLSPPSMDDQTDDWSRLETAIRKATGIADISVSLPVLRRMGGVLREGEWLVTAVLHVSKPPGGSETSGRLIQLKPGHEAPDAPLWGISIDIGTTTATVWLVDLISGQVVAQASEYNRQIQRGEDVISRVIYAGKKNGQQDLRELVLKSLNTLVHRVCTKASGEWRVASEGVVSGESQVASNGPAPATRNPLPATDILKATIAGNSIMMHLLLGIAAESIRLSPFVTAVNHIPTLTAAELGLQIYPEAVVECLPGVASYVGADISAGVLSSKLDDTELVSLFMDIGTNGEIVLGCRDWLITCACSAGPAFEGAGVGDGMRATRGAIEEVWIDGTTFEPTIRIIGDSKPRGLCGSALISLLGEMFMTGVIDKGGNFNLQLPSERVRSGENGPEYVVVWASETWHEKDIAITHVDVDNLLRAKAAIYAGIDVLADSVGIPLEMVEEVLIGGSFGKFINVEKAILIGLLPDKPWEQFKFLGNTAVLGAYHALLNQTDQQRISDIAGRMTYIELSADNSFYEAFTSALFLPHTDMGRFPTVADAIREKESN
ncbi:MAG: DUF4445 domain-containing protein [Chloroflexi bacterium]|nr:MAG: DUF4445 domain-containing protein [Chloroflexota bacterium]